MRSPHPIPWQQSSWRWYTLTNQGTFCNQIKPVAGVYVIAAPKPIQRVLGEDRDGILDIGMASNLRSRLQSFVRCAGMPWAYGHMAGIRYRIFGYGQLFPLATLRFGIQSLAAGQTQKGLEGAFMTAYCTTFREMPPLNLSFDKDAWVALRNGWDAQADR